jgi:putative acetyltransferase
MLIIRSVQNKDAQDLFGLLSLVSAEYPGCFVDPHGDLPDMLLPESSYSKAGGAFWVVEDEQTRICACCGVDFPKDKTAELHRLYVRKDKRGQGLAQALLAKAEAAAKEHGAKHMILWSDTRFETAHKFYLKAGYTQLTGMRKLNDISNSSEYGFEKVL